MELIMFTSNSWDNFIPFFVFLGIILIGVALKYTLLSRTTLHLSKSFLIGLLGGALFLAVLITVLLVLLVRAR